MIFRGIQQNIGPISLSTPYEDTDILLDDLPSLRRGTVERTISARSLDDAAGDRRPTPRDRGGDAR